MALAGYNLHCSALTGLDKQELNLIPTDDKVFSNQKIEIGISKTTRAMICRLARKDIWNSVIKMKMYFLILIQNLCIFGSFFPALLVKDSRKKVI